MVSPAVMVQSPPWLTTLGAWGSEPHPTLAPGPHGLSLSKKSWQPAMSPAELNSGVGTLALESRAVVAVGGGRSSPARLVRIP